MIRRKRKQTSSDADWSKATVSNRPRHLQFPVAVYFKSWRYLRWYLLLLLPVIPNAIVAWLRGFGLFNSIGLSVLGAALAFALFASLCLGIESSNWGTYFRSSEPIRYWLLTFVTAVFYVLAVIAGYLKIAN